MPLRNCFKKLHTRPPRLLYGLVLTDLYKRKYMYTRPVSECADLYNENMCGNHLFTLVAGQLTWKGGVSRVIWDTSEDRHEEEEIKEGEEENKKWKNKNRK